MLTNKQMEQSRQLTEEYGDGRDHERRYPDPARVFEAMERRHERQRLEHSLATTFVELQDERNPEKRQKLWMECLRLAAEIKRMNSGNGNLNK